MTNFETSETLAALGPALATAQGAVEGATKGKVNPAFKSKYADLASVWEACRGHLAANGLSIIQSPGEIAEGRMGMTTMLLHGSGEWIRGHLTIPLGKVDAQAYGSAVTYARRYALAAFVGVAPEDDDGAAATKAAPVKKDYGPAPMGDDWHGAEGHGPSSYSAKKNGGDARFKEILAEIHSLGTMVEVGMFTKARTEEIRGLPEGWRKVLREKLDEQRHLIAAENDFRPEENGGGGDEGVAGDASAMAAE